MLNNFPDFIVAKYIKEDPKATCRVITFQVTEDCCLNCSYCYQINKSHKNMSISTAKQIIDMLFNMYKINDENAFINHHTKGVVLELIGGEPLMNIEVCNFVCEYFLTSCIKTNHPWLFNSRVSLSTNGMLYFNPIVQQFIEKYKNFLNMTITIDGPKQIHDSCRVDYNGIGSFDQVFKAWLDWNKKSNQIIGTKVTIAPENLPYLDTIINFFIQHGCIEINANPIYEHNWTKEEASLYYKQLKKIADVMLQNIKIHSSLFKVNSNKPLLYSEDDNYCGGAGDMLAFDPDGIAYPCLRYMPSSLGDIKPIIIGNTQGIYNTKETIDIYNKLKSVTRKTQSSDECINCPVASGCGWCSAYNYQCFGTCDKRLTNICWMHRAEALANVYYWNQYFIYKKEYEIYPLYLPRDVATNIIDNDEYDKLLNLTVRV